VYSRGEAALKHWGRFSDSVRSHAWRLNACPSGEERGAGQSPAAFNECAEGAL